MKTLAPWRHLIVLAAALCLTSCDVLGLTIGASGRRTELARQRAKWNQQQITSYRFTYRLSCFCGSEFTSPTEIEVRAGDIATARYAELDQPIPVYVQTGLPTIDALFDIVADAIERDADLLEVTYDPTLGFPRRIAIDYRFNTADEERTHVASKLEIILPTSEW